MWEGQRSILGTVSDELYTVIFEMGSILGTGGSPMNDARLGG